MKNNKKEKNILPEKFCKSFKYNIYITSDAGVGNDIIIENHSPTQNSLEKTLELIKDRKLIKILYINAELHFPPEQIRALSNTVFDGIFNSCNLLDIDRSNSNQLDLLHRDFINLSDQLSIPNIPRGSDILAAKTLEDYINVIETDEGYHWDLYQIIQDKQLTFDFCYIDGEHTFESTALAFYLIDQILEPNGIVVFDDYDWTIEKSLKMNPEKIKFFPHWLRATKKQRTSTGVKMVCDNLVIPKGYRQLDIEPKLDWKFFQKI